MKVFIIGLGQAGGKITDLFLEDDKNSRMPNIYKAIAVNTANPDLVGLRHVPKHSRVLIGETVVKGHGVGANNVLGSQIAKAEIDRIMNAIDRAGTTDTDVFLIVTGFGGGTGSGTAPIVARRLKETYNEPVYVLGILPADQEGSVYILNAARSMKTLSKYVDSMIMVDNGAFLRPGESMKDAYARINREIVKRFGVLSRAGEVLTANMVGEMVVDASEIAQTLDGTEIATLGYASERIPGSGILTRTSASIFGKNDETDEKKTNRMLSVIKAASKSRLLLPCDFTSIRRALVVVAGPPEYLTKEGMEAGKSWLEENIAGHEVRGGDFPSPNSEYVAALVLLAGITGAEKVDYLFEKARDIQRKISSGRTLQEYQKERKTKRLMEDIEDLLLED